MLVYVVADDAVGFHEEEGARNLMTSLVITGVCLIIDL